LIAKNRKVLLSEAQKKINALMMKRKGQSQKPIFAGKSVRRKEALTGKMKNN